MNKISRKMLSGTVVLATLLSAATLSFAGNGAQKITALADSTATYATWDVLNTYESQPSDVQLSSYACDYKAEKYVNMEHCERVNIIVEAESVSQNGYAKDGKTFTLDDNDKGVVLSSSDDLYVYYSIEENTENPWFYSQYIAEINVVTTASKIKLTSGYNMFFRFGGEEICGLEYFDTSEAENMAYMFYECTGVTSLNVSGFDTSKATDMSYMFFHCARLKSIDLSNFNTENVDRFTAMFAYCNNLTSIKVSEKFDMSRARSTYHMLHKAGDAKRLVPCTVYGASTATQAKMKPSTIFSNVNFYTSGSPIHNLVTVVKNFFVGLVKAFSIIF